MKTETFDKANKLLNNISDYNRSMHIIDNNEFDMNINFILLSGSTLDKIKQIIYDDLKNQKEKCIIEFESL